MTRRIFPNEENRLVYGYGVDDPAIFDTSVLATLNGVETLTNKTISGSLTTGGTVNSAALTGTFTNGGNVVLAGAGAGTHRINGGLFTGTINSGGTTIAHGLGSGLTPSSVVVSGGTANLLRPVVTAWTSTTFTVKLLDASGVAQTSSSVDVHWIAFA